MEFGKEYIKVFDTEAEYESFKASSGYVEPNVSYISGDNVVHYNPLTPPTPSHDYVDLGLPSGTLWATMNVGASSITDYGNYYQYGKGSDTYQITSGQSSYSGTENPLAASADTATQVWGGDWHMPTQTQFEELTASTTHTFETDFNGSGVNGFKFTAQNNNYIFLPAAGFINEGSLFLDDGAYWSSTPDDANNTIALDFNNRGIIYIYPDPVDNGYSIRPVMDAPQS